MKNLLLKFFSLIFICTLNLGILSCSNDDENGDNSTNSQFVGRWKYSIYYEYEFFQDGTMARYDYSIDRKNNNNRYLFFTYNGRYKYDKNTSEFLWIYGDGMTEAWSLRDITQNEMVLLDLDDGGYSTLTRIR